jgi:hypothetical protein
VGRLKNLWNGESGWNEKAYNASSGATGIPQSLPGSKMASAGADWKTNPTTQIKWGLSYIASRYGNPLNAYSAWLSRSPHWYEKGTGGAAPGLAWVGEKGPELVNFRGGEDVLSNPQSMQFAKANGIKLPGYASGTLLNASDRVHRDRQRVEDAKDAARRGEAAPQGCRSRREAAQGGREGAEGRRDLPAQRPALRQDVDREHHRDRPAQDAVDGHRRGHHLGDQVDGDEAAERRLQQDRGEHSAPGRQAGGARRQAGIDSAADRRSEPVRVRPGRDHQGLPVHQRNLGGERR